MKKLMAALAVLIMFTASGALAQNPVNSFDDIQFWTGTGTNRAALVIEFQSGTNTLSVAWGYRWDGDKVMQDMLFALAGRIAGAQQAPLPDQDSDPRLSVNVGYFDGYGFYINSMSYVPSGLGGGWPLSPLSIADDYFVSGAYAGIYFLPGSGTWTGDPMIYSESDGLPTLQIDNGGWYGVVHTDGPPAYPFSQPVGAPVTAAPPVPVPQPAVHMTGQGQPVVTVPSVSGYRYQLVTSGDMTGTWTNQGAEIDGTGGALAFSNSLAPVPPAQFFRVIVK